VKEFKSLARDIRDAEVLGAVSETLVFNIPRVSKVLLRDAERGARITEDKIARRMVEQGHLLEISDPSDLLISSDI
jgi:hypothetical protein